MDHRFCALCMLGVKNATKERIRSFGHGSIRFRKYSVFRIKFLGHGRKLVFDQEFRAIRRKETVTNVGNLKVPTFRTTKRLLGPGGYDNR